MGDRCGVGEGVGCSEGWGGERWDVVRCGGGEGCEGMSNAFLL